MNEFNFGDYVEDTTTRNKGVVSGVTFFLSGCTRYEMQIEGKESSIYISSDSKVITRSKKKTDLLPFEFDLGEHIQDKVTGNKFIIQSRYQDREGFNRYYCRTVKPKSWEALTKIISFEEAEIEVYRPWWSIFKEPHVIGAAQQIREKVKKINRSPVSMDRSRDK